MRLWLRYRNWLCGWLYSIPELAVCTLWHAGRSRLRCLGGTSGSSRCELEGPRSASIGVKWHAERDSERSVRRIERGDQRRRCECLLVVCECRWERSEVERCGAHDACGEQERQVSFSITFLMSTNCLSQKVKTEWKKLETAYRIQNPFIVHNLIRMSWTSASLSIRDPNHFFITVLLFEMLLPSLRVLYNVPSTC